MEIQDFVENIYMRNFKEWDGKIIWKGKETLVRLTIYKECDNVELEKEKMFRILKELYLNQDEWNEKVKDTMVKYFYDVLNDDFFDDGAFPVWWCDLLDWLSKQGWSHVIYCLRRMKYCFSKSGYLVELREF